MKGLAHFITGVTAASFFPWSIQAAQEGNPLFFVLGGACALLPDTLDFKVYRFFYRHDVILRPDAKHPDPQAMAEQLAGALAQARDEGRTVRVKLATLRLGADRWRQYQVRFDAAAGAVRVRMGPVVNTGQVPEPGTGWDHGEGKAPLPCPILQTYEAVTQVDIFDGPTFGLEGRKDGSVVLHFLPWHREWTHSFTLAAALALAAGGLWTWRVAPVILAGMAMHLFEDQVGFMGSNLFFPLTRRRLGGLHWMRSGDAWPNFLTVWICCLLLFWNLYRAIPEPLYSLAFHHLALYGAVLPLGAAAALLALLRQGRSPAKEDPAADWDTPDL